MNKVAENLKEFVVKEDNSRHTGKGYVVGYSHSKDLTEPKGSNNIYLGLHGGTRSEDSKTIIFSGHPIVVTSQEDLKDMLSRTINGGLVTSFPYIVIVQVEYQFHNISVLEHKNNLITKVGDSIAFETTSFSLSDLDKIIN
jgi:hypothetical protein